MTLSLTQTLGGLVADTAADAIPDAIRERAKISLAHNLLVALAGRSRAGAAHLLAQRLWGVPAEATRRPFWSKRRFNQPPRSGRSNQLRFRTGWSAVGLAIARP